MAARMKSVTVNDKEVSVSGQFFKIARIKAEYYEWTDDPRSFATALLNGGGKADLFTFLKKLTDKCDLYEFPVERDSIAAVRITTYDHWWNNQINDKTRNMIRRSRKSGVDVKLVEFTDDLVKGIKDIYDESPLRQGKPFQHYGKDLATLKTMHISFLDRSQFIGAFYQGELIGFAKLVHDEGIYHLMHIISKIAHRSKAPTNALIDKSVEICAEQGVTYLHYGVWCRRGLGDFKKHHAFERFDLQRYFMPLTFRGKVYLALNLHRNLHRYILEAIPENWFNFLADVRGKWNSFKINRIMKKRNKAEKYVDFP